MDKQIETDKMQVNWEGYEIMEKICSKEKICPVETTIQLIGGKYKAIILWHLKGATLRYSELHKRMPKATDKMLAQQLRELEKDGLINRKVYPVVPPKTEYSLTDLGKSLFPILDEMCKWGEEYKNSASATKKIIVENIKKISVKNS